MINRNMPGGEASSYRVTEVRERERVPETESSGEVMTVGEWRGDVARDGGQVPRAVCLLYQHNNEEHHLTLRRVLG